MILIRLQAEIAYYTSMRLDHQDAICHGLHDRIIQKTLGGKVNADVELKECIALGNNYSKHIITNKSVERKEKAS